MSVSSQVMMEGEEIWGFLHHIERLIHVMERRRKVIDLVYPAEHYLELLKNIKVLIENIISPRKDVIPHELLGMIDIYEDHIEIIPLGLRLNVKVNTLSDLRQALIANLNIIFGAAKAKVEHIQMCLRYDLRQLIRDLKILTGRARP